jgi:trimethylamine--corrinoid protein Co-methyltransferase
MALAGYVRRFPSLKILTDEQLERIHQGTLRVLWNTGVHMEHRGALETLERAGCRVDYDDWRVRFPTALVEDALRRCPSTFTIQTRDPSKSLQVGGNSLYMLPFPGHHTVDLDTWEPRHPTRKDFYDGVKVLDALPSVHGLWSYTPYFAFEGVPPSMALLESLAGKIRNSGKMLTEGYSKGSEEFAIRMAQAVGAELCVPCLLSPPLTYYEDAIGAALHGADAGFPIRISEGAVYGGTAPASIAGALVSACANLIAPIVLLQVYRPGTRVFLNDFTFPQNMTTGAPGFGNIAISLHAAAFNQIWHRYGVPVCNGAAVPGSKRIDFQSGYERATNTALFALSGANFILLHGGVAAELTHHPLQAILDDDISGMVGRFLEGIAVNDEMLALDLIEEVGPVPGHFLGKQHTRKWWKSEQYIPKSADTLTYPEWLNSGKKSCLDYARERMDAILADYKPLALSPSQEQEIERILEEARAHYEAEGLITADEMKTYRRDIASGRYPYA